MAFCITFPYSYHISVTIAVAIRLRSIDKSEYFDRKIKKINNFIASYFFVFWENKYQGWFQRRAGGAGPTLSKGLKPPLTNIIFADCS